MASSRVSTIKPKRVAKHKVDEQPFFFKKNKTKRAASQKEEKATTRTRWLLCKVFHNWVGSRKTRMHSFLKVESPGEPRCKKILGPIRRIRFTKSTPLQASIREKNGPSLGKIQVKVPHQRSPYAVKFKDRSHEDSSDVPEARLGILPQTHFKLKENDKTTFHSPAEEWVLPAASTKEPEER